ncbi:MAG: DUF2284 domain-containing protein [Methanobrevibacter sp.]|uniref:DUF2284 domain-containing protein n=1 Tax=Methanobrevibacter sp. TaxID=66852 RepID=UPI0026E0A1E7|nr:DUF2284 domain-containing protein [Methanobrevibacter sp.]MDO5849511.1 DUF2284 domain-containing protein [Methanobrevibacter sp.]
MFEIQQLSADMDMDEFYERYVDIEKFGELCKDCDEYGKNWSCPPFDFDPDEIWKSFNKIKIIAFKYNFNEEILSETFTEEELETFFRKLSRTKLKLMNIIYGLEAENPGSLGLYLGTCNLCSSCTKMFGMRCKMPFKMRYSIESLGGNVDQLMEDVFETPVLYAKDGKLPDYIVYVGGLLYDRKE